MPTQIRDTQFGRLVRVLSRRKIFQYPDEIDSSICNSAVEQGTMDGNQQRDSRPNSDADSTGDGLETGTDVHFVGWYGENDPEVSPETEGEYSTRSRG